MQRLLHRTYRERGHVHGREDKALDDHQHRVGRIRRERRARLNHHRVRPGNRQELHQPGKAAVSSATGHIF